MNVLLALSVSSHLHHRAATEWFDEADFEWATTAMTEAGFVRLALNSRVTGLTISGGEAIDALHELREAEGHLFVPDDTSLFDAAIDLRPMVGTKQVSDFHLVNLVAQKGLRLATFDRSLLRSLAEADREHVYVIDG